MMKPLSGLIFLCCCLFGNLLFADTTIYIVRHAEKAVGSDPVLITEGEQRATDLARVLRSAEISACFATEFKRTQLTAKPTAENAAVTLQKYVAGKEADLVEKIKNDHTNQNLLVVGHSDTVPIIISLLGVANSLNISEKQFDNLIVVRVASDGTASMVHLHYGAANPD